MLWEQDECFLSTCTFQSDKIRTIIKARGLWYPNVNGKTFAVFRVDRKHHVMSALSMLGPSPDWLVGVSSLELCLKNCSWLASKTINLYPWDAGTSDGLSYVVVSDSDFDFRYCWLCQQNIELDSIRLKIVSLDRNYYPRHNERHQILNRGYTKSHPRFRQILILHSLIQPEFQWSQLLD